MPLPLSIAVGFFIFSRPDHTRQTISSLRRNKISKLYIFCDGPKNGIVSEKMAETRQLAREIDWCEVVLVERTTNLGIDENIRQGFEQMFLENDAVIHIEDDCVLRDDYLEYMTKALEFYRNDECVSHINGYQPPVHPPRLRKYDAFYSKIPISWGPGIYKRSWNKFYQLEMKDAEKFFLSEKGLELSAVMPNFRGLVQDIHSGRHVQSWDYSWLYWVNFHGTYCVAPYTSLVKNVGCDGTGVHFNEGLVTHFDINFPNASHYFKSDSSPRFPKKVFRDRSMEKKMTYFYGKPTFLRRLKDFVKCLLSLLGLRKNGSLTS